MPLDGIRHRVIFRRLNPDSPFPHAIQVKLYSLARLDAEIAELRTIAAEITGIALLVSLGLIAFVSCGLSGPIGQLTRAVTQIGRGHLDTRVPVLHHDEIGTLSTAFNQMAADLALQDKYRTMLDAVADPAVARRLMEDSAALSGEQREVTMLFCDIRGFTALTEQMDPAILIELLNHHMSAMTEEAYTHGGTVDKFVGDLILVLFGAPTDHGPHTAAAAVRCALDLQARCHRMNETAEHPLAIGIGIATGRVVAGCMGSDRRLNYTVLGHRVNLAPRLCSLAAAGQVIVDDATLAQLPPGTTSSPLQPARLKGISEPVVCHLIHTLPPHSTSSS